MLKSTVDNFPNFLIRCAWIGILMTFLNRFSRVFPVFLGEFQKNHTISGNSVQMSFDGPEGSIKRHEIKGPSKDMRFLGPSKDMRF